MNKIIYYVPAFLLLCIYLLVGASMGFTHIEGLAWIIIGILIISGFLMSKNKWYGSIGGLIVGGYHIYLSTLTTHQVVNIERSFGIVLIFVYLAFGGFLFIRQYKNRR